LTMAFLIGTGLRAATPDVDQRLSASTNDFGYRLLQQIGGADLHAHPNQNILLSPISATMAMEMLLVASGTDSTTRKQMTSALGFEGLTLEQILKADQALLGRLQTDGSKPYQLFIANSAWGNSGNGFAFKNNYVGVLSSMMNASAQSLDFAQPSSVEAINAWASDHTNKKITEVIDASTLGMLSFVLLDATYFKGDWFTRFMPSLTKSDHFTRGDGTTVDVQMMNSRRLGYVEVNHYQVMALPYAGDAVAMYVVMPDSARPMSDVLDDGSGPTSADFWAEVKKAKHETADFQWPRFELKSKANLVDALKALGVRDAFDNKADFSNASTTDTSVSRVQQDTYIKIDENGTEAAAVTQIGAVATAAMLPPPKVFVMRVDRPFLFSIVERTSDTVLFTGAVSDIDKP
jgi:serine protease inhibitor